MSQNRRGIAQESRTHQEDRPRFTTFERDRRWDRVRALMARDGLDVLIAVPHTGHHDHFSAYSRYLTGLGGYSLEVGAVFPLAGDVTAFVVPDVAPDRWREQQDWVEDIRTNGRDFGAGMIARLLELNLRAPRIGMAGLDGVPRFADGIVAHKFYSRLSAAMPDATLVDCTRLLDRARYTKGPEEIEFLGRSVAHAEAAIDALRSTARSGIPENAVYAAMMAAMIERGTEIPAMIMWAAGTPGRLRSAAPPTPRRLVAGDFLRVEVEGRVGGYCGQVTQMAVIGRLPDTYGLQWELQQEAVAICSSAARPGMTLGELARISEAVVAGSPCGMRFLMHGRGLGDDAPIYVFSADDETRGWEIEENASFIIKPIITREGHADIIWGDSVITTSSGAVRLGTKPPEIIELG